MSKRIGLTAVLVAVAFTGQVSACALSPEAPGAPATSATAPRSLEALNVFVEEVDWVGIDPGIQGLHAEASTGEIIVQTISADMTVQRLFDAGLGSSGLTQQEV